MVISAIKFFDDGRVGVGLGCGVVARCTVHMSATPLRFPSRTTSSFLSTSICVAVNVDVHPSSYSFHMEISSPGWRWGEMYSVLAIVDNKGLSFSYAIWVS